MQSGIRNTLKRCIQGIVLAVLLLLPAQGSQPQESLPNTLRGFAKYTAKQGKAYGFYRGSGGGIVVRSNRVEVYNCPDETGFMRVDDRHTLCIEKEPVREGNSYDTMEQLGTLGDSVTFRELLTKVDDGGTLSGIQSEVCYKVISPLSMAGLCQERQFFPWMRMYIARESNRLCTFRSSSIGAVVAVGLLGAWSQSKKVQSAVKQWGLSCVFGGTALVLIRATCAWFAMKQKHDRRYYPLNSPQPPTSFLLARPAQRTAEWGDMQYVYDATQDDVSWYVDITLTERLLAGDVLRYYVRGQAGLEKYMLSAVKVIQRYNAHGEYNELLKLVAKKVELLDIYKDYHDTVDTLRQLKQSLLIELGPFED